MKIFTITVMILLIVILVLIYYIYHKKCLLNTPQEFPNLVRYHQLTPLNLDNHIVYLETIHKAPDVVKIHKLLTDQECDHLINISKNHFSRSTVTDKIKISDKRTSHTHFIPKSHDDIVLRIEKRLAKLLNIDICQIESLQIVRYEPGQKFDYHYDWFNEETMKKEERRGGQRTFTIFGYLNNLDKKDKEESNGKTCFKQIDKCVFPEKGMGVFWKNMNNGVVCRNVEHAGLPPKYSLKFGLNVWVRQRCFVL